MFKSLFNTIFKGALGLSLALILTPLTGCGGGGGGNSGGGSNSAGRGNDSAYGVRVLHAAIDAAPVDVSSSASAAPVVSQQFFAGDKGYRSLPDGAQVLSLTRAFNPGDVLASFSIEGGTDDRYSILLYGDLQSSGLSARLIKDGFLSEFAGAVIRVVNGINGASSLTATISTGGSTSIGFGQNSEYIEVPAGEVNLAGSRSSDGAPLGSLKLMAEAGRAYTVLFAGEVGFYSKVTSFIDE